MTASQCFALCNISKSTFYRYIDELREEDRQNGIIWDDETPKVNNDVDMSEIIDILKHPER